MPEKRYDRVRLAPQAQRARAAPAPTSVSKRAPLARNTTLQALVQRAAQVMMRRKARLDAFAAPPAVEQQLGSSRGNGQPLPSPARERMESAFGASFEGVTLHTDGDADQLTRQVDAVAFTHGRDIYFSSGSFAPDSTGGQKLLAHELTHVVQQRSGRKVTVGAAHDPAESEADQVAEAVVQRLQRHAAQQSLDSDTVARQEMPEEEEAQAVRRQEMPEEEELAQTVRRQAEADEEEELAQPIRRQEEEEELALPIRRQEEEEEEQAQALRRAPSSAAAPVTSAAAPASETEAAPEPAPAAQESVEQSLFQQGVAAYREGDRGRALELFQQVTASPDASESERASALWNVGRIYQEQGNNAAALAMYHVYLAQPSIPDERREVAQRIVDEMEREQAASGSATDVESAGGAQPTAAAPAATEAAAAATPERTPSDPRARADALYQQAVQAYRAGELRQALELWQQVLDIDQAPESSRANTIWNIGRVYQDMGNDGAALTMYRTFLAQPSISDERREVAQRIVEDMEREQATSGAPSESAAPAGAKAAGGREVLPSDPEQRVQALRGLATQAYQSGDYATALEHFQQLMRTAGLEGRAYAETLYNMAQCYRRLGNNGAAIDMYRGFLAQPDATAAERERAQRLIAMCQH
jgi:tetratricopeptide (TPR) repeat protein